MIRYVIFYIFGLLLGGGAAAADQVSIAAPHSFVPVLQRLGEQFRDETGHRISIATGKVSHLSASVQKGEDYDVYMSSDDAAPRELLRNGKAVSTPVPYAYDSIVLVRPGASADVSDALSALRESGRIAVTDPRDCPYAEAARRALTVNGHWSQLEHSGRLVMVEDMVEARDMLSRGEVDSAILPASLARGDGPSFALLTDGGGRLRQDAVLLRGGASKSGAQAWMAFLTTPEARRIIAAGGFGLP